MCEANPGDQAVGNTDIGAGAPESLPHLPRPSCGVRCQRQDQQCSEQGIDSALCGRAVGALPQLERCDRGGAESTGRERGFDARCRTASAQEWR